MGFDPDLVRVVAPERSAGPFSFIFEPWHRDFVVANVSLRKQILHGMPHSCFNPQYSVPHSRKPREASR